MTKKLLNAAVKKYAPMLAEGASEETLRTAIGEDADFTYTPDEVTEIVEAVRLDSIVEPGEQYVVLQEFRDITDFNLIHKVDDDVSGMDKSRLAELVESGLVGKKV